MVWRAAIGVGWMAGRLAAADLEFVDGTFEQFTDLDQRFDELPVLILKLAEELSLTADEFRTGRRGGGSLVG